MPLSEQEQRMLDEMERQLMGKDADVVSAPRDGRTLSYRNIVLGIVLVLLGLGALVVGVALPQLILGVAGFLLMLGGVIFAVTPVKGSGPLPERTARPSAPKPAPHASFMDRMNERWDRRRGEQ